MKPQWPQDYEANPEGTCVVKAGVRERLRKEGTTTMTPEEIKQAEELINTPITAENVNLPVEAVFPTNQERKTMKFTLGPYSGVLGYAIFDNKNYIVAAIPARKNKEQTDLIARVVIDAMNLNAEAIERLE